MDQELTPNIKAWLESDPAARDLVEGATLVLRITRNKILYSNIMRNLDKNANVIEYHLQKAYNLRLQNVTKEQVKEMLAEVEKIDQRVNLRASSDSERSEFQRGKRGDHDDLPDEIKQLYIDNGLIIKKMRDCHTHLRLINSDNSTCPDSDRYPWAKEIIALDKKYRENWYNYDHYSSGIHPNTSAPVATDARAESKRAAKLINLNKTRYAVSRNPELGAKIAEWYSKVLNPTEKMTQELKMLGILG